MSVSKTAAQASEIEESYADQGYVVVAEAIPRDLIDQFLQEFERVKRNPFFVYFSQSRHLSMRPRLSGHGLMIDSMHNASRLWPFTAFGNAMRDILYHTNVSAALQRITGDHRHVSWQNMFFDASTGTVDHQDSWYLDTDPPGCLVGVWYALEDIHESSGPFFVYPESHKYGLIDRLEFPNHDAFVAETNRVKGLYGAPRPKLLKKGDILLWHPYLVHSAFNPLNPSLSRKSFTSHFYGSSKRPKDTESAKKRISIYEHDNPKPTINPQISEAFRFPDAVYSAFVYSKYFVGKIKRVKNALSMRREDYK